MSRAFVKEDVDVAERSSRRRTTSGLPPGAQNYLTASGEAQLRARLTTLRKAESSGASEIADLEDILATAVIVPPNAEADSVIFGSRVTLELADGTLEAYRIVGVDEVTLDALNISWVSPLGRALLGAELGQRVIFPGEAKATRRVIKIE
jgi:transcription elongation factor GreB